MPEWWEGTFDERMARRAARRGPEFYARTEERKRIGRYRDIWREVLHDDALKLLPHHVQIQIAPRIRGCGAAAKRAGFAG